MDSNLAHPLGNSISEELPPDNAQLYMRVHRTLLNSDGSLSARAFRNQQDPKKPESEPGMSTYWNAYAEPAQVLNAARKPQDNVVVEMNVGKVRKIPLQKVVYTPNDQPVIGNAHTDVYGPKDTKDTELRKMFLNISSIIQSS